MQLAHWPMQSMLDSIQQWRQLYRRVQVYNRVKSITLHIFGMCCNSSFINTRLNQLDCISSLEKRNADKHPLRSQFQLF